jgi:hypothetical protein
MLTTGPDAVSSPDNAYSYVRNRSLRELLARRGSRHLTTQAYRPRANGKVERFHQDDPRVGLGGHLRGVGVVVALRGRARRLICPRCGSPGCLDYRPPRAVPLAPPRPGLDALLPRVRAEAFPLPGL